MFVLISKITKATIVICSLLFLSSCSTKEFEFDIKYPKNIQVKKDSTLIFYVKIINSNNKKLLFTNIKTSCQCVILSKRELLIKPKEVDSIKIKLFGSTLGKSVESLILTNENLKKFRNIRLEYEVKN
jgi:hypothetical protein